MPAKENYWKRRNEELEQKWYEKSRQTVEREILEYYRQSLYHIQKDIQALYANFAAENNMNLVEARKLLQGNEFRSWRMDMKEYIARIQAAGDTALLRELNTLVMRNRITRLDKLYAETLAEIGVLANKTEQGMDKFLTDAYKDLYYRNLYEVGKETRFQGVPVKVDSKKVENALRVPWSGLNYSQRIWKNDARLARVIQDTVVQDIHRGTSVQKLSRLVSDKMDVGYSNAVRLVRTEMNYVQNRGALDSIADAGMEFYEFSATLDGRTSPMCRSHDGKVYPIEDARPGENCPPLHPHCRSTIFATLDGPGTAKTTKGTRIARDENGKNYRIPAGMNYTDWKAVYIDKTKPISVWELENRVANSPKADIIKESPAKVSKPSTKARPSYAFNKLKKEFRALGVVHNPVSTHTKIPSFNEIIANIAGGDLTKGSCSSVAFTYIGNKFGLNVLDFRGGDSRFLFNIDRVIQTIGKLPNVNMTMQKVSNPIKGAIKALKGLEQGKEYYFVAGRHAAIVRNTGNGYEYLELQSARYNGWKSFTAEGRSIEDTLRSRFGCENTGAYRQRIIIMEVDSFKDNEEFRKILGYINTNTDKQLKGRAGGVK